MPTTVQAAETTKSPGVPPVGNPPVAIVDPVSIASLAKSVFVDLPRDLAVETVRFAGARVQAHVDHAAELLRCRSAAEVVDVQVRFAGSTVASYGHEAGVMAHTVQDFFASHTR